MVREIKNEEVLEVQCVSGLLPYDKASKMAGKEYRRYSFENKVFISGSDTTFHDDLESGNVASLKLDIDADGKLALAGYVSYTKIIGMVTNQAKIESIKAVNFKPTMTEQEATATL